MKTVAEGKAIFWRSNFRMAVVGAVMTVFIFQASLLWACDPRSVSPGSCGGCGPSAAAVPLPLGFDETDAYSTPVNCDGANLPGPNCHPSVTADGQWLFFEYDQDPSGMGQMDIYMATANGSSWNPPLNLGAPVNTQWHEGKPMVVADGSALYFQATRPGGLGGSDIYVSYWSGSVWGTPQNLGSPVNSNSDECTPYISYDNQRLYFQSPNRPGGPGGGDLWMSQRSGTSWRAPAVLPPPVNTPALEWYCCESPDGNELYLISSRSGGYGNIDLWRSIRQASGQWGPVLVLPAPVNTSNAICSPYMAADGRLFFGGWLEGGYGDLDVWWTEWTASGRDPNGPSGWEIPAVDEWNSGSALPGATVVLALLQTRTGAVLAGSYPNGSVYRSTDAGRSWSAPISLPGAMRVFRFLQARNGTIFAATYPNGDVFKSTNDGVSWTNCANIPLATEARALLQTTDQRVYVGCAPNAKVYWTDNDGASWNLCGALGFSANSMVYDLAQDNYGRIYAGAWSAASVFYSDNGGTSWQACADFPIESLWYAVQSLLCIGDTLYAGCWVHGLAETNGRIFKSSNRGASWQETQLIAGSSDIWELAQGRSGQILAALGTMASGEIVYRSPDQGQTWISTGVCSGVREAYCLQLLPRGILLTGTAPGGIIFRNTSVIPSAEQRREQRPLKSFPNPFNSAVQLSWEAGAGSISSLGIYDLAGRLVKMLRLADAEQVEASWDGRNEGGQAVAAGIYLCRAECAQRVEILKLVYLR